MAGPALPDADGLALGRPAPGDVALHGVSLLPVPGSADAPTRDVALAEQLVRLGLDP